MQTEGWQRESPSQFKLEKKDTMTTTIDRSVHQELLSILPLLDQMGVSEGRAYITSLIEDTQRVGREFVASQQLHQVARFRFGLTEGDAYSLKIVKDFMEYAMGNSIAMTPMQLARFFVRQRRCSCVLYPNMQHTRRTLEYTLHLTVHFIQVHGILPSCAHLQSMHMYRILMRGQLATPSQLREFVMNRRRFYEDPERFYQDGKHRNPMQGIDELEETEAESEDLCALCQDTITKGSKIYTLPCGCKSRFHASEAECLGEGNIKTWLRSNSTCPTCNQMLQPAAS